MDTNNTSDDMNEPQDNSGESALNADNGTSDVLGDDSVVDASDGSIDEFTVAPDDEHSADDDVNADSEVPADSELTTDSVLIPDSDPIVETDGGIGGGVTDGSTGVVPPPPVPQPPVEGRLVRDPHATFGGVLSGIAHRYGWDVSLTRLGFLILVVTTWLPFFVYFVAWLVIPRATMWPPAGPGSRPPRASRLSSRDLGLGLLGLAALVAIGIGSGDAAAIIVPIALIAAGVWLLMQSPREQLAAAGPGASSTEPVFGVPLGRPSVAPPVTPAPSVSQFPVEPPSRGRRALKFGLGGLFLLILLAVVAIPLIVLGAVFAGDLDFDTTSRRVIVEDEVPANITQDVGELVVDFRTFDFDNVTTPEELDVELDVGDLTIVIPDDVRVSIDAQAGLGDLDILGQTADGIDAEIAIDESNPQLILDARVDLGALEVVRESDASEADLGGNLKVQQRSVVISPGS